jgi:serine/threonine protein kinase
MEDAPRVRISLADASVGPVQRTGRPDGEICLLLLRDTPTTGLLLLCNTLETAARWADRLCLAGCTMSDLHLQINLLPDRHVGRMVRVATTLGTARTVPQAGRLLALKFATGDLQKKQLVTEAKCLLALHHPALLRSYGLYQVKVKAESGLGMLIDLKEGRDLARWIPPQGYPEWVLAGIMSQICIGLAYLHGHSILHRDVKPTNVLCQRAAANGSVRAVLADFAVSAHVENTAEVAKRCGSGGYIAPEVFCNEWPSAVSARHLSREAVENILKVDMFSFGMLVLTAALGENPFCDPEPKAMYLKNARAEIPAHRFEVLSVELQALLGGLLEQKPSGRMSSSQASDHPWFLSPETPPDAERPMPGNLVAWEDFVRLGEN